MITYGQYNELMSLENTGIIDSMVSVICIVQDLTDVEVLEWPLRQIKEEFNKIKSLITVIGNNQRFLEALDLTFGRVYYKSIYHMSLGEYIDLEHFMKSKDYNRILTLIYRKRTNTEWDADAWEPWGGYSHKRKDLFNEVPADVCITAINQIFKEKQEFLEKWDFLFDQDDFNYDEELSRPDITAEERSILVDERRKDELRSKLNFEILINGLTGSDQLKINDVLLLNVDQIFKFLAVQKQLEINKIV